MDKILVVDDDLGIQKQLKWALSGLDVVFADDRESAITQLRRFEPRVVTLDLGLPPDPANASEGLCALEEILSLAPATKVIVVTGNDDKENALKAISLGAYDYYHKPIDTDIINLIIQRAMNLANLEYENLMLSRNSASVGRILGNSDTIQAASRKAEKIAQTDISVLLQGESGTGKEVFARTIHESSNRKDNAFVAINCASIPENLLESELFGYEKGAFTGASKTTLGKIETAQGGTLFLDEIGDMPIGLQAKMLRFLQERVPPLRDRDDDVILLAKTFLNLYREEYSAKVKGFSEDALSAMLQHKWPGNIRELQNKLKSAVVLAEGQLIQADDLGLIAKTTGSEERVFNLREVREIAETKAIRNAHNQAEQNVSKTAELLGVTRPTLYSLIDKYRLDDLKAQN